VTSDATGSILPHLARVRIEAHSFHFDVDGGWAIIVPIFDAPVLHAPPLHSRNIINYAAFDPNNDELRRMWKTSGDFAVGLADAVFDARLHAQFLLRVHYSVWSWLKAQGAGMLPVDWRKSALFVRTEGYDLAPDGGAHDWRRIEAKFAQALALPRFFVPAAAAMGGAS
jgi:hypothetical protein